MTVISAIYTDDSNTTVTAVIDGVTLTVPLSAPTFYSEQIAAWIADGNVPAPAPAANASQVAQAAYAAAVQSGLVVTWSASTSLNATYALDQMTQFNMTAEIVSIMKNATFTNAETTRNWPTAAGVYLSFTVAQFEALSTAIAAYIDALKTALATALSGGTPSWPSANVTINL